MDRQDCIGLTQGYLGIFFFTWLYIKSQVSCSILWCWPNWFAPVFLIALLCFGDPYVKKKINSHSDIAGLANPVRQERTNEGGDML